MRIVAFLRAVNVGGRVVKMTELKRVVESAGMKDVSTFIASGNVIFTSSATRDAIETRLERAFEKAFGFAVPTMARSVDELQAIAAFQPFPSSVRGDAPLYIGFLKAVPSPEGIRAAMALQNDIDVFNVHGREIYWLARKKMGESTIPAGALDKALKVPATVRSVTTVDKLVAKYCPQ